MAGIVLTLSGLLEEKGEVLGRLVSVEASPIACLQGSRGVEARSVCFGLCGSIGYGLQREGKAAPVWFTLASLKALVREGLYCFSYGCYGFQERSGIVNEKVLVVIICYPFWRV